MIVLDASATVEWLLQTPLGMKVEERIASGGGALHAPHLLDLEVTQVLRRFVAAGIMTKARGEQAVEDLLDLPLTRHAHDFLVWRIWELRESLTAYDAAYVALAEGLAAPLVTCDRKIAAAPGHRARVEVVTQR